jgi:hypothetical protein
MSASSRISGLSSSGRPEQELALLSLNKKVAKVYRAIPSTFMDKQFLKEPGCKTILP